MFSIGCLMGLFVERLLHGITGAGQERIIAIKFTKELTDMKTTITAKNMVVTPGITDRIIKKTAKMDRYIRQDSELVIRMSKERNGRRVVELTAPIDGMILRAEASTEDNLFLAIDQALAKLEKQIHRHREKLVSRLRSDAFVEQELEYIEDEMEDASEETTRKIVKHKHFPVRPMALEDAVLQMELLGHSFFVFVNIETDRTNVIYLRKDGNLGLLEPEI